MGRTLDTLKPRPRIANPSCKLVWRAQSQNNGYARRGEQKIFVLYGGEGIVDILRDALFEDQFLLNALLD